MKSALFVLSVVTLMNIAPAQASDPCEAKAVRAARAIAELNSYSPVEFKTLRTLPRDYDAEKSYADFEISIVTSYDMDLYYVRTERLPLGECAVRIVKQL